LFRAFWASFSDSPDIRFWSVLKLLSYFWGQKMFTKNLTNHELHNF
jgi:hypothetical protein